MKVSWNTVPLALFYSISSYFIPFYYFFLFFFTAFSWKDWCWSWSSNILATWCEELTHLKRPWCWEGLKAGGKGDDRGLDGWIHHRLNGHGFGWTLGVGDGQGGLAYCGSWGRKESDMTENWTELNWTELNYFFLLMLPIGSKLITAPAFWLRDF